MHHKKMDVFLVDHVVGFFQPSNSCRMLTHFDSATNGYCGRLKNLVMARWQSGCDGCELCQAKRLIQQLPFGVAGCSTTYAVMRHVDFWMKMMKGSSMDQIYQSFAAKPGFFDVFCRCRSRASSVCLRSRRCRSALSWMRKVHKGTARMPWHGTP